MSLLSRDELRVVLCRDQLQLVRMASNLTLKGWQYQVLDKKTVSFETGADTPWGNAIAKLETVLSGSEIKPKSASVVLSNHFLRYAVVEVDHALQSEAERVAYVKHRFGQLYGASADTWELRLDQEYPGAPFFASAIEGKLIQALREMFERVGVKLQSIQPSLMRVYNQCQLRLQNMNAWFVLFEHGTLCLVWLKNGHPNSVRTIKVGEDWQEKLPEILEREAYLSELDASFKEVFLWSSEAGKFTPPRSVLWKISRMQPAALLGLQDQYDENYVLAMCG